MQDRPDVHGATLVELGFTSIFGLRRRKGAQARRRGNPPARDSVTKTQLGRMLRKAAVVYAVNGLFAKAAAARAQALAKATRSFDQLR